MASWRENTPSATVRKLANAQDRFGFFKHIFQYTKPDRRICDVQGLGPAVAKDFHLTSKQWDEIVGRRTNANGRCKGLIFHSFRRKHFYRRCDAVADGHLCSDCSALRKNFKDGRICLDCEEYTIDKDAVMKRPAIVDSLQFWNKEGTRLRELHKLDDKFPFLKAKAVVHMLFYDSMLLFANAKSRAYTRPAWLVRKQNAFVRYCLATMLRIIRYEGKKKFLHSKLKKRMK